VLLAVVRDVLVDLVGDGDRVVLTAQRRDELQLFAREDLAGRVVRRVDDDRLGLRRERRAKLLLLDLELRAANG
jgi:hypothetical protein